MPLFSFPTAEGRPFPRPTLEVCVRPLPSGVLPPELAARDVTTLMATALDLALSSATRREWP